MDNQKAKFSLIYDQFVNKIYRFVFIKVNSSELAEDITSETFTRCWESVKNGKDIQNVQAFLYRIARNLVTDQYRQNAQAQFVSLENAPQMRDTEKGLEEMAMLTSDVDRVKAALANINDNYRDIIIWYYLDEFTVPEIARILNKSEEAVRVQIHRAINALREKI